jgi:hypothetical protein
MHDEGIELIIQWKSLISYLWCAVWIKVESAEKNQGAPRPTIIKDDSGSATTFSKRFTQVLVHKESVRHAGGFDILEE